MKYSLYYKDKNGKFVQLDLGGQKPAVTIQANDLNELKDRQATFSQQIKLPKNSHNCRKLGFVNVFEVDSRAPYEPGECRLLCDNADLVGTGAVLYVDGVGRNDINCQVVAGLVDVFAQLDNISMGDSDFIIKYDITDTPTAETQTPGGAYYRYLFATVDREPGTSAPPFGIVGSDMSIERRYLFPSIPFTKTIRHLFAKLGFSFITDIEGDGYEADKDYLYCGKARATAGEIGDFDALIGVTYADPQSIPISGPYPKYFPFIRIAKSDPYGAVSINGDTTKAIYTAVDTSDVAINALIGGRNVRSTSLRYTATVKIDISITRVNGDVESLTHQGTAGSGRGDNGRDRDFSTSFTPPRIHVNTGDVIEVSATIESVSGISSSTEAGYVGSVNFESYAITDQPPVPGDNINLLAATGFEKASEMLKAYIQMYGLVLLTDHDTRTVYAYTMNGLYDRIDAGDYYDWSDKLVKFAGRNMGFRLSKYGQTNNILLKENSSDGVTDKGTFTINDKTLETTKDLFTVSIESGRNLSGTIGDATVTAANIPVYDVESEEGTITREYEGTNPHLVTAADQVLTLTAKQGTLSQQIDINVAVHTPMQRYIDRYYNRLVNDMLHNTKTLKEEFMFRPVDLENIDLLRPVYLEYYGAFFYISKINNYIAGRPTVCELVKL